MKQWELLDSVVVLRRERVVEFIEAGVINVGRLRLRGFAKIEGVKWRKSTWALRIASDNSIMVYSVHRIDSMNR